MKPMDQSLDMLDEFVYYLEEVGEEEGMEEAASLAVTAMACVMYAIGIKSFGATIGVLR